MFPFPLAATDLMPLYIKDYRLDNYRPFRI
jgi:hypothetical protein